MIRPHSIPRPLSRFTLQPRFCLYLIISLALQIHERGAGKQQPHVGVPTPPALLLCNILRSVAALLPSESVNSQQDMFLALRLNPPPHHFSLTRTTCVAVVSDASWLQYSASCNL